MKLELSGQGRYALRALVYLARNADRKELVTANRISAEAHVPRRLLARILSRLSGAGLVASEQGRAGGSRLARPAGEITLKEAVEAVEGPFGVTRCIMADRACVQGAPCALHERLGNMPWMFFLAALAIPAFYAVGLLARPDASFPTADYWRFMVVHLWVEDFLELFTTVMVAYIFVLLGVISERVALAVIFLDIVLYSVGGVVGTLHHLYFSGTPASAMALGAFFSAAEVIPLTFLTFEAWSFLQLGANQESRSRTPFPHRWAVMFLVAVGFWNFLGAGILGFLINLPIVSYYEIGTALTAAHAHGAMMGVYGMLAAGFALFCLRYLIPEDRWSERAARWSFWSLKLGLAWMIFATLFPLGILQLYESVNSGYFEARSLEYVTNPTNALIECLRLPGDVLFILGGVLPLLYLCYLGVRHTVLHVTMEEPEDILFTEIVEPAEPRGR